MQEHQNRRPFGRLRELANIFRTSGPGWRTVPAAALAVLVAACGGRQISEPTDALEIPHEVLEATLERLFPIADGRIRAWLEIYGGRGRARVRQAVLYSFPDRVRIETISPFDTSLNVLVIRDGLLDFYDLQSQQYFRGAATPANLTSLAPIPLTPEDIVRVLAGGPPLDRVDPDPSTYALEWDRRIGAYVLTLPLLDGGSLDLHVRHGDWALAGARESAADGTLLYEVRCGDFRTVGTEEITMPHRIRVRVPAERVDLELEVERYDLNPGLPDPLFELQPPRGVEITPL
jgi:hypothetical protein